VFSISELFITLPQPYAGILYEEDVIESKEGLVWGIRDRRKLGIYFARSGRNDHVSDPLSGTLRLVRIIWRCISRGQM
jgi:hypothetical protein